jgi:hypothetical protein
VQNERGQSGTRELRDWNEQQPLLSVTRKLHANFALPGSDTNCECSRAAAALVGEFALQCPLRHSKGAETSVSIEPFLLNRQTGKSVDAVTD